MSGTKWRATITQRSPIDILAAAEVSWPWLSSIGLEDTTDKRDMQRIGAIGQSPRTPGMYLSCFCLSRLLTLRVDTECAKCQAPVMGCETGGASAWSLSRRVGCEG